MYLDFKRLAANSRIRSAHWAVSIDGRGKVIVKWYPKSPREKIECEDAENYRDREKGK